MFMQWSDELSLGMEAVDDQHRWLFDTTNRLYDELSKGEMARADIGQIVESLVDYVINHFVAEEVLFERYMYPGAEEHQMQHDALIAKAMTMLQSFEAGADVGRETLELLKNWLTGHIMQSDRLYADFIREQSE